MISARGLAALEEVLERNPNAFDALARETLEELFRLGRAAVAAPQPMEGNPDASQ